MSRKVPEKSWDEHDSPYRTAQRILTLLGLPDDFRKRDPIVILLDNWRRDQLKAALPPEKPEPPDLPLGHSFTGGDQDGNCTMLYFYSRGPGDAPGNRWCGQPRDAHRPTEPEKP